jgi:hypothetical protein
LVVTKLKHHPLANIKFSNEEKMAQFARTIQEREPAIDDVIRFMDGLALSSECTSELIEQNAMCNGYHNDTMVNNIIVYGPDGKVFFAQSIFLVVGMMDLLWQTFCLIFRIILGIMKCALVRVSLEAVMLISFLLVRLLKDKQRS